MQEVIISHPSDAGQRLDKFLKKYLPNIPLGGIYKMLRVGKIKVNRKKKDQTYKIELDDVIQFFLSDEELKSLKEETWGHTKKVQNEPISKKPEGPIILYEDEYLLVVNKPAGINVHPGDHKTTECSLIEQVQDYLGNTHDSLTFRPSLVHRIDRDTSGCILIAKRKDALEFLLDELQNHRVKKVYHAVVLWAPLRSSGTIREKILRIENAKNEAKVRIDASGQSAVTHYSLLETGKFGADDTQENKYSFLECQIETGRTHQIRVHLSHIGHPIIGDKAYGNVSINSFVKRQYHIVRQLLHARELSFIHPATKKIITVQAPYPQDFLSFQK